MTRTLNLRSLIAASAVAAATTFVMFAQSGQASASGVLDCRGKNSASVLKCCNDEVRQSGLPNWMRATGKTCSTASVVCKAKRSNTWTSVAAAAPSTRKCKIMAQFVPGKGGDGDGVKNPGGRGNPNGNPNGNPSRGSGKY
ncbi:hypothetical protein [Aestuariivirga sp.]|uniref:hypothetical protein n=1 Tax=Aestuariivirga sp. TaxID=2650926 RepID=UPI003593B77A